MKSFEQFVTEETKEVIYTYKNRYVITTNHFYERAKERFNRTKEELNELFDKAIDAIINDKQDSSKEYLIFSKKLNQGIVVDWRRQGDRNLDDGKNHLIIITLLPLGKSYPRECTERILVECTDKYYSQNVVNYICDILDIDKLKNESIEVVNKYNIEVIFVEKKLHDINYDVIEI